MLLPNPVFYSTGSVNVHKLTDLLAENYGQRNCIPCFNFDEATETCTLANIRPPARIIAYGCEKFDYIPF